MALLGPAAVQMVAELLMKLQSQKEVGLSDGAFLNTESTTKGIHMCLQFVIVAHAVIMIVGSIVIIPNMVIVIMIVTILTTLSDYYVR